MSTGELTKALAAARSAMKGTVYKGGTNQHQRYPYVGHEHVMTSGAREALSEQGLALVQTGVEYVGEVPGGKVQVLLWRGSFRLLHTSGESLDLSLLATTQANDKSAFVASTSLDRTAFLRVLALAGSAEEDPEHDVHDKIAQSAPPYQPPPRREAPPAAPSPEVQYRLDFTALLESLRIVKTSAQLEQARAAAAFLKPKMPPEDMARAAAEMVSAQKRVVQAEKDRVEAEQAEAALREEARLRQQAAEGPSP
jgi:hypothetical protein